MKSKIKSLINLHQKIISVSRRLTRQKDSRIKIINLKSKRARKKLANIKRENH
jgi:hypothetical protein